MNLAGINSLPKNATQRASNPARSPIPPPFPKEKTPTSKMKNEATLLLLTAVTALICPPLSVSADNHFADDLKAPQLTKSAACQTIHDTINALNNTLSTNFKYQSLFFSTPMDVCQNVEAVVSASKKIAAKCNQTISNSSVNPFQSNGKEKE